MKNKTLKVVLLFAVMLLFVAAFSAAAREEGPQFVEELAVAGPGSGIVVEPKGASGTAVYIVQLEDAPLASFTGTVQGLNATSPSATGARKLDITTADSVAYREYLADKQAAFLNASEAVLGRELDVLYQYDVAYNGVAMTLSPVEASAVAKQAGVALVTRDQWRFKQTDVSPEFIGATDIWSGDGYEGAGTKGEGVIVGIVDTGIWPEHPSVADDGSFPAPVGWSGSCQAPDDGSDPLTCTNKLIGAKHFLAGYITASGGAYDGSFNSARDDDGHGTHTATTSAGNEDVTATLLGVDRGKVSGIAPRAHVAAYKALGPGGGVTSDLVGAIDEAVADGVDVINYSIGGGATNPWGDPDSEAFLAARDAGVFVATSAGNAGPGPDTIGSPGNAPWMTTVGASTSNRHFISDITLTGPGEPPTDLFGASVTDGVTDFDLVDAEGIADSEGDDTGLCLNPYDPGTFEATDVVLCKRGQIARVLRGDHVEAGGGGGVILYNADPAEGLSTDNYVIPAVHVVYDTGIEIKNYLTANTGSVKVSFTAGEKALADSDSRVIPDMMADFSSRGPNGPLLDVIKVDVTAPGVQILAGASPEHDGDGAQGELFQAIQGTSMSSPHVAGAGALLVAAQPTWSPPEIESALMTTALMEVVKEDGTTPADAFDMGAGRIDVTNAVNAPLILHETKANYENADPGTGGDPKTLNNASMGNSNCVGKCSWMRTVENATDGELTWDATVDGIPGTVEPASFTLAAGATQMFTVTVDVAGLESGSWAFATVYLDPTAEDVQTSHMPIAVTPDTGSLPDQIDINTRRDSGAYVAKDVTAVEITEMTLTPYGLVPGEESLIDLAVDETNDDAYDDLDQVFYKIDTVPDGAWRLVYEVLDSTAPDIDMFVGMDTNGNGMPDPEEEECASTTGSWAEYCNIDTPTPGNWWVLVQNWAGSEMPYDTTLLATGIVDDVDAGNMTFDAPEAVPQLDPFDLTIKYDLMYTHPGQVWFGAFSMGSDPANPTNVGTTRVNLYRHEDDVVKTVDKMFAAPGDTVTYTLKVNPNLLFEDVDMTIVDMIPEGMILDKESVQATSGEVEANEAGDMITWTGTMANPKSLAPYYNMTTSADDENCDTGFGGYVDLAGFDIFTQADVEGDTAAWTFFGTDLPFNFYGQEYTGMTVTDDGFAVFDADTHWDGDPWTPQTIPNADPPNNLAAMLWQDMEIFYSEADNHGISAATAGPEVTVVEFDNAQFYGGSEDQFDFEIVMTRSVDDSPGAYEIVFAYDNLDGDLAGPLTVGVENAAGDAATALVNNTTAVGVLENGFMVCFDSVVPNADVTITYTATVDDGAFGPLTNYATSTTSSANSQEDTAMAVVYVGTNLWAPVIRTND